MLTLACVVVNDGSVVVVEMEDDKTVYELKKSIKEKKMYAFPADELTLHVAKTNSGEWMKFSDPDVKGLKNKPPPELVQSFLSKPEMEPLLPLTAFDFQLDDAKQIGVVHVLVEVHAERWREFGSAKKAKLSDAPLTFTLDSGKVLDLTATEEGTLQCTKALSTAFYDFGGFPTAIFVRKEMQMVWTILYDNYIGTSPPDVHYVLMGSPGVGKSVLLLLFCCYLATHHGFWILFSRTTERSELRCPHTGTLLIFRGTHVTAYPSFSNSDLNRMRLSLDCESTAAGKRFLVVGDGYNQEDFKTNGLRMFITNHLLATSAHFRRSSQENRMLLALPAWSRSHLDALATALNMQDGDERYWYSGGSVREFQRDLVDLKRRLQTALWPLVNESDLEVVDGYAPDPLNDSIRRLFVPRLDDAALYTLSSEWLYNVDIPGALKHLASKWQLKSMSKLRKLAMYYRDEALQGQVFEVLVHKLAHDRSLELDVRDSAGDVLTSSRVAVTTTVSVKADFSRRNKSGLAASRSSWRR